MNAPGKQIYRVVINAAIDEVWRALTKRGEVLPFFFGSVMDVVELAPGARICMRTRDGKFTGVVGDILTCEPPHKLAHTFKFTALDEPPCIVTYELREVDGGTQFTLTTEQVPPDTQTEKYMAQGGDFIVATLKGVVEGRLPWKSRFVLLMCRLTQPLTPGRCRSEHWPNVDPPPLDEPRSPTA